MLEKILDFYPKAISILDQNQEIVKANQSFLKNLIYTKEEIIGKQFKDILSKDISNIELEQINDLFTNKLTHIFLELYLLNGFNSKVLVRLNMEHILNREQGLNHYILTLEHIFLEDTNNNDQQLDLLWKVMFEKNQAVKLLINPLNGRIIEANSAACKYYGYNYQSLTKMNISEINMLPDRLVKEEMANAKKEKRSYFNFKHRLANAEIRDVEVWSSPIQYLGQKILYSVVHDVTEKKKAEIELRKSEEKYRLIVQNQNDLVVKIDKKLNIVYANPAYCRIFNKTEESLIGKPYFPFYDNKKFDLKDFQIKKLNFEQRLFSDSGEIWINWSSKIKYNKNDEAEIISVGRIITDLKKVEQELIELNQNLEKRVKERTLQLEEINNELEAFSYSISHDLRSPLRSIHGFTEILIEDYAEILDSTAKSHLKHIINSAERMDNLISEILNLSRLTRSEISYTDIDLSALCDDIIKTIRKENPNLKIEASILKSQHVTSDKQLLYVAFDNIIRNAVKYSIKNENIQIEFNKTIIEDRTYFYIKDNGIGFEQKYSEEIFRPFKRLHSEKDFPGFGIGLSTVKRIFNKIHGNIHAQSEPNKGAMFYFSFENPESINN